MTFADRVLASVEMLRAKCPRCSVVVQADPSMRAATVCGGCRSRLWPKRLVTGISFTIKETH